MKDFVVLIGLMVICLSTSYSQAPDFNMDLLADVGIGSQGSDVWGYVDENGTEYAIIGSFIDSRIFSLADPASPSLVKTIPGGSSSWRDFKTFDTYLYIVADGSDDGLIIVDLSRIAVDTVTFETLRIFGLEEDTINITRCHNLNIDEANGMLVISGCRVNNGGTLIFDLNENPALPKLMAFGPAIYSHDNITRDGIIYSSDLDDGLNIIDAGTSEILGNTGTGLNFTHNAWINDEATLVFTTDEVSNAYVEAYDISDLDNIEMIDRYRPQNVLGAPALPHNVHFMDNYLITSYYSEGVKIIDALVPDNLVEVGSYDTYLPPFFGGFNGLWGVYPFLPSGLVLGSDLESGLFVWQPTYERAFRVTGHVRNANSGEPLFDASVEILSGEFGVFEGTDVLGNFKTGFAKSQLPMNENNSITLSVSKEGFEPFSTPFETGNSESMDFPEIELVPIVTDVNDPLDEGVMRIHQNPTSNYFIVDFEKTINDVKLSVFDAKGQLIEYIEAPGSRINFGSNYPSGIYFLEANSTEGFAIKRLIKN